MIEINELSFAYKNSKKNSLTDINLVVKDGEFAGIIGESGAGKSTLCNAINALIPHHYQGDFYGSVKINGVDTFETTPGKLAVDVGSVFQDIDSQLVNSFVDEEIRFGLENHNYPKAQIEQKIDSTLDSLGILSLKNREISSLSGGQKQKVAIAAILALEPKIIILDEPTGELDPASSHEIFSLLKKLNKEKNITIIVVEQKIMLLSEFVDRLIVMEEGKITADSSVRNILQAPEKLLKQGINCPRVITLVQQIEKEKLIPSSISDKDKICITPKETAKLIRKII